LGAIAIAVTLCDGVLFVLPLSIRISPSSLILFDIVLAVIMAGIWWVLVRPLRVSQNQLRSFLDNATVGLLTSTADGRLRMVNRTLVEMLGYASAKDLLGRNLGADVYRSPEERARVIGIMSALGEFEDVEANWKRKDGSPLTVSLKGRTIRSLDGQVVGFEGAIEDVTEQRRQQRHLRLVEEALNAAANAIVITDSAGAIEWVNPAFTILTGYALDEVMGKTPRTAPEPAAERAMTFAADHDELRVEPVGHVVQLDGRAPQSNHHLVQERPRDRRGQRLDDARAGGGHRRMVQRLRLPCRFG
jgi:PAS domain S-box-containing protein